MEVEGNSNNKGGFDVYLHPLVVMNISDHVTREKHINRKLPGYTQPSSTNLPPLTSENDSVIGAILGSINGRRLDLHTSFELVLLPTGDIDMEYYETRINQYLEVFPTYEFIGWYSCGKGQPASRDFVRLRQFETVTENPFLVQLDSDFQKTVTNRHLPLYIYEKTYKIHAGQAESTLTPIGYKLASLEAEMIAVDHVARIASQISAQKESDYVIHLQTFSEALALLRDRTAMLRRYLEDVKAGKAPKSQTILREIYSLCNGLSASQPPDIQSQFNKEWISEILTVHLATATKIVSHMQELSMKMNAIRDPHIMTNLRARKKTLDSD